MAAPCRGPFRGANFPASGSMAEMDQDLEYTVGAVVSALRDARRVLFVTGAGISADSGLPTYRGVSGLYDDGPTEDGVSIEDALSGEMLAEHPEITWRYIREIEEACRGAAPNAAHDIIAKLQRLAEGRVLLTQNVDGLHRAAGSASPIEVHGTIDELRCTACAYRTSVKDYAGLPPPPAVPRCPRCNAVLRPDVVLFGEMLPEAAIERLRDEVAQGFDLVIVIGTTAVFPYIQAPVLLAARGGRTTVEINPGDTMLSEIVTHRLRIGAADAMRHIWTRYQAATR